MKYPEISNEKLVGQLLMAGFPSPTYDAQAEKLLTKLHVGNYIYFSRNIVSAEQTAALSRSLQEKVLEKLGMEAIITTDQEGGIVSRMTEGAALIPGNAALSAAFPNLDGEALSKVRRLGYQSGSLMRSVGINVLLAPVLDVNMNAANPIIGSRSYSDNPERVASLGCAMLRGAQEGGAGCALKHYPGHGNVSGDTHLGIPVNDTSREILEQTELLPFERAVKAGAAAIMTCHVRYPALDSEPATLSYEIMTRILREKWGFEGVVMSDCMEMDAIAKTYGVGEGAVRAVEAGVDIITVSHHYSLVEEAYDALLKALEEGRITRERLELSFERVLRLKKNLKLKGAEQETSGETQPEPLSRFQDADWLSFNREIARKSITMLSPGSFDFPSLPNRKAFVIAPDQSSSTGEEDITPVSFTGYCQARFGYEPLLVPMNLTVEEAEEAALKAKRLFEEGYELAVLGLYNARLRPGQAALLEKLRRVRDAFGENEPKQILFCFLGAPYDKVLLQEGETALCTYEYTRLSLEALIWALENGRFEGVCPFSV